MNRGWLFPGQGSQSPEMLQDCRGSRLFEAHIELVDDLAGERVLDRLADGGNTYLERNEIVSTLTVLVSAVHLERLREEQEAPLALAGYSVGQWTALVAAAACTLEDALRTVWRRAELMNSTLAGRETAMCGVVGLALATIEQVCQDLRATGRLVAISNINAPGNVSLAGDATAIAECLGVFERAGAYRVVKLPVAGAWHSSLLQPAVAPFRAVLDGMHLRLPDRPVADNVSGAYLPLERDAMLTRLAEHIASPVRWLDCTRTLIAGGVQRFTEIGWGDMLTRFGMFTDRSVSFEAYPGAPRRFAGPRR